MRVPKILHAGSRAALGLALVGSLGFAHPKSGACADEEPVLGCDRSAIQWVLPGDFERARERAVSEGRMVLVKGISFGVDELGAQCATKGRW